MNSAPIHPVEGLDEDDDDRLIGRIMSRREVLALFGVGGRGSHGTRARSASPRSRHR